MQFCNFTQDFLLEASNAQYSTATDAYADMAEQKFSGDPKGRTYAQLTADGQYNAAIKGKTDAAREIREALEGKMPQAPGDITASMSVTVNLEAVRKKLFGDD